MVGTKPSVYDPKLLASSFVVVVVAGVEVNQCSMSWRAAADTGGISKKTSWKAP
jgi:hypothetical protein